MAEAMTPVPDDHPLKVAWEAYKASDDYQNSKGWALQISPMVQASDPDGDRKRRQELMPAKQREQHVEGALWAAFMAGWHALRTMMENSPVYFAEDEGEVAKILGNTLAEAGSAPKGKPS